MTEKTLLGYRCVVKRRVPKGYREKALDIRLRFERTKGEARLLHKAKLAGVPCPTVFEAAESELTLTHIRGKRPKMDALDALEAGIILAKLHSRDIIHGDYTPANLIRSGKLLYVIDFGLGFISKDIEDKAVDVFSMLQALGERSGGKSKEGFIAGYGRYEKSGSVLKRVKDVEKRVRYAT